MTGSQFIRFKFVKYGTFTITIEDDFKKELKINIPDFQKYFLVGYMPQPPIVLKACQLVNHIQFMSGIEWTKGLDMWPCHVLDQLNIFIL
jgi:hypothetical protein